jgi:hypothetical protein
VNLERNAREDRNAQVGFANSAGFAFLVYAALAIALTWPLATGLTHDVPGDFGDPLFTSWALAWDAMHLGRGWWSANIFAPHPLSLAYSEHFLPQALQAWPIYAATKNPILCYNLLFLSTFALSGLGMFLLGRELTGSPAAGLVAGLAFAFAPYRIASIPHLQVLSSAWMPFVLFGLRRHFATGRLQPLAGAAAAWLVQNLSCGYYLLFFSPIVFLYIVWELTRAGLWRNARTLCRIGAAIAIVFAGTAPFLLPYLELRQIGFSPRSLIETQRFSADVYAYFTADPNLRLWGPIAQAWPKAEGLLFPGLTIAALAIFGATRGSFADAARDDSTGVARDRQSDVARPFQGRDRGAESPAPHPGHRDRGPKRAALQLAGVAMGGVVVALLLGWSIRLPGIKITSLARTLAFCAAAWTVILAVSRDVRGAATRWLSSPAGIFSAITVFALVMSFGPDIHAKGRELATINLYAAFYAFVPGFDGVRVPARFGMIVTLGLAALAALGAAAIDRRHRGRVSAIAGALILLEAIAIPIPINQNSTDYTQTGLAPLPASVAIGSAAPEVYRFLATLPSSTVLMELPLGEPAFDVRYMFYSTLHWKRLVNGYSGGAPQQYEMLTESLKDLATRPDRAWQAIADSTATHAVVHEGSYTNGGGRRLSTWLRAHGALEIAAFGTDHVFALRSRALSVRVARAASPSPSLGAALH